MTPGSKHAGGRYGTGIERAKGKKTAVGTGTALFLYSADTGAGHELRNDHGQRVCRELCGYSLRPLQGDHRGDGPLTGIRPFLKKN